MLNQWRKRRKFHAGRIMPDTAPDCPEGTERESTWVPPVRPRGGSRYFQPAFCGFQNWSAFAIPRPLVRTNVKPGGGQEIISKIVDGTPLNSKEREQIQTRITHE